MAIVFVTRDGYENRKLYEAALEADNEVYVLDPLQLFYKLDKENTTIYSGGMPLDLSLVVIRLVGGNAKAVLGKVAGRMGISGEPVARFKTSGIAKINSELNRELTEENHPISYICFSNQTYHNHKHLINFPVIYKPAVGRHGKGIELFKTIEELDRFVDRFNPTETKPLFLQELIQNIIREYRVYLVNNKAVNWVKKVRAAETKKLFKGRKFEAVELPEDVRVYCELNARTGLVGLDIVKTREGKLYIIEQNRAPEWERTDKVTNKNTAKLVLEALLNG